MTEKAEQKTEKRPAQESRLHPQNEDMWPVPPRQNPYHLAFDLAFETLLGRTASGVDFEPLGVKCEPGVIRVPMLNHVLVMDLVKREVCVEGGGRARIAWALLALHYLCAEDIHTDTREVSFGHFTDSRAYLAVFTKRILGRFLGTIGRTGGRFIELSEQLGGTRLPGSGLSYRFDLLPRVPITIVRHDGDEEFGPGANVI